MDKKDSEKVGKFKREIVEVCKKHGLVITVSMYDSFQVWPLNDEPDLDAIGCAEDRTDA